VSAGFDIKKLNINFNANMKIEGKNLVVASGNFGIFGIFDVKLDVKDEGIAFINIFNKINTVPFIKRRQ
jgi:translocation and assembly module TamB